MWRLGGKRSDFELGKGCPLRHGSTTSADNPTER
jgi:hypothetical protein